MGDFVYLFIVCLFICFSVVGGGCVLVLLRFIWSDTASKFSYIQTTEREMSLEKLYIIDKPPPQYLHVLLN